jgi:ureidoacrylate peracid hydrolase
MEPDRTIRNVREIITYFRKLGLPVVTTRLEYSHGYGDGGLLVKQARIKETSGYIEGSEESKIVDEIRDVTHDSVDVRKTRYDAFCCTSIERILRERQVSHLTFVGVLTNVCVESTLRSAFDRDFEVAIVADATTTYSESVHRASLSNIGAHFGEVLHTEEFKDRGG